MPKPNFAVPCLLVCILGLVAIGPHFVSGYPIGHSYYFNVSWTTAFLGQFLAGDLYPRWLVDYPAALGAPIFYFYAPAPFFLAGLGALACGGCGVLELLTFVHWSLFALSGMAFYFWVREFTGLGVALLASACYVLLPYHYLDVEVRSALGESMAYIWAPLILLGLRFLQTSFLSLVLAAFAYAGLIYSHLPSALLFTPVMAVFTYAWPRPAAFGVLTWRLAAVGILGVALSAAYMVPALMLRDNLPVDSWVTASGPHYHPENWLLLGKGGAKNFAPVVFGALATSTFWAMAAFAAMLSAGYLFKPSAHIPAMQKRALVAAALSLVFCWFMMSVPSEWLWVNLDFLRQVQFPWRLGPVVDLCSATVFAIGVQRLIGTLKARSSPRYGLVINGLCALLVVAMALSVLLATLRLGGVPRQGAQGRTLAAETAAQRVVEIEVDSNRRIFGHYPLEYRPKWVVESSIYNPDAIGGGYYSDPETAFDRYVDGYRRWAKHVSSLPPIRVGTGSDTGSEVSIERRGAVSFGVDVTLSEPSRVHIRRIYFPSWRLRDLASGAEVAVVPNETDGLIAIDLPAGRHQLLLAIKYLDWEVIGLVVSALALLAAIWLALWERRSGKRPAPNPGLDR